MIASLCAPPLAAQQPLPSQPYVMHVYTNLMQLPALVLDTDDRPFKHLDTSRFAISLGEGPAFRPVYVRQQGDDPISLSILLDLSGDINDILPALRESIPGLAPDQLHAKDHVSVYALDCKLIRSADDLPANRSTLAEALTKAVTEPALHDRKRKAGVCGRTVALVDALAVIARPMVKLSGRKVILVVSTGYDGKSSLRWSQLRQFVAAESISVFGMTYTSFETPPSLVVDPFATHSGEDIDRAPNPLEALCDLTGGIELSLASNRSVPKALPHFVELLRQRYILEFHRPNDAKAGRYSVNVSLDHTSAHIRVGGTTVHVATAAELATPELAPEAIGVGGSGEAQPQAPKPEAPR